MPLEQFRTELGFVATLDGAVVRFFRADNHRAVAGGIERAQYFFAPGTGQMSRKKSAVSNNDTKRYAPGGARANWPRCRVCKCAIEPKFSAHVRLELVDAHHALKMVKCEWLQSQSISEVFDRRK